jgi:integrase
MQRADGRWQILLRHTDEDGVSRHYTVNGITAKDARAGEIKKRLQANLPARDRKITLGEFAGEWIESTLEASDRKGDHQGDVRHDHAQAHRQRQDRREAA